ncbi:MAG: CRTAC1 family protein [Pirellulales bacterium]
MLVRLFGALNAFLLMLAALDSRSLCAAEPRFVFRDTTRAHGLLPEIAGIRGHAAGWGDVDGDGWLDLYVGTFGGPNQKSNLFFRNRRGAFVLDEQPDVRLQARSNSGLFADLDNDGDLDLYVSSMPQTPKPKKAGAVEKGDVAPADPPRPLVGCMLFRNDDGGGTFTDISKDNGACPTAFGGRSATVLDYDGDGLLDLLVGEDPLPGYNGSPTKSSRLFRNLGGLKFEDVTQRVGIPAGIPGLGVLAADFNGDGRPDIFLAAHAGGNVLLLNDGHGKFVEPAGLRETFAWPTAKGDDMVCGVTCGDVNGDGLPDLVLGQHFERPWLKPVANRLYLHRGVVDGVPRFEDVTEKAGLTALPMKSPHVELVDMDNDGLPDLLTSMAKFVDGAPRPVIFRNLGVKEGLPRFAEDVTAANDFPNDDDRAVKGTGKFFEKMLHDKKVIYSAPAQTGDYDNDGRLDVFLASWWPQADSLLLRNETPGGHYLFVEVQGRDGVNRMGVGARVELFAAGKSGDQAARLGVREILVGHGYVSSHAAEAHFGLGERTTVDVVVTLPHGKGTIRRANVKADQRIVLEGPDKTQ